MVVVNARVKILKLLIAILIVVQVCTCMFNTSTLLVNKTMFYIVDGGWSNWSVGNCSKLCGGGNKTKIRTCSNPAPSCGGNNCIGESIETVECNTTPCEGMYCIYYVCMYITICSYVCTYVYHNYYITYTCVYVHALHTVCRATYVRN